MKAAIALPLIVTLCLAACALPFWPTKIETDVNRWSHYVFSDGSDEVFLKVPGPFRVIGPSLPQSTYIRAQRLLLDAQYDFGAIRSPDTSEFELKVTLTQLKAPLSSTSITAAELDLALIAAYGHRIQTAVGVPLDDEVFDGRTWIHYGNTTDVTYGQTRESYATVVSVNTALIITAWYGPDLRKDSLLLDSRRQILRDVRDTTRITNEPQF